MIRINYEHEPRRDVLCIDVKSFYASVESVKRRIHPLESYIVVMSNPNSDGGIVLAASPRVKKEYGIKTGSRRFEIPRNSKIQIVEPRMSLYLKVNMMINDIYREFVSDDDIHIYSIDESFLDVSSSHALYGDTRAIAEKIQTAIWKKLKLVTAIGIGDNPLLAKLALDNEAKNSSTFIAEWRYEDIENTVWKISPITNMWGIGERTANNLYKIGINSVFSLSQYDVKRLKKLHGVIGEELFYHAHGVDHSIISEKHIPVTKSYGTSQILKRDYTDSVEIEVVIREMAETVASRLRKSEVEASVIHFSAYYSRDVIEKGFSHQIQIDYTSSTQTINETCIHIFRKYYDDKPVRRISISCSKIRSKKGIQLNLFEQPETTIKKEELENIIDQIRNRFGYTSLIHASSLTRGGTAIERSGLISGHKG